MLLADRNAIYVTSPDLYFTPPNKEVMSDDKRLIKILDSLEAKMGKKVEIVEHTALYFLFPTFLAGLYGMNVDLPMQKNKHAFWIILSACVIWIVVVRVYLSRLKLD